MKYVHDILRRKGNAVWSTSPESTVFEALREMAERDIGSLLVLDGVELQGIFSERDYARKVILEGKASKEIAVSDIMTREIVTVGVAESVERCMNLMTEHRCRHLPVMDDDELVGVVSVGDVVKEIITDKESTIHQLEDYIVGRR